MTNGPRESQRGEISAGEPADGREARERATPPPGAARMRALRSGMFVVVAGLAMVSVGSYVTTWRSRDDRGGALARSGYRCPMHPGYAAGRPGDCPICGMSLERIRGGETGDSSRIMVPPGDVPGLTSVYLSPERTQLIGVRTAVVESRVLGSGLDLLGFVVADPSRLRHIEARVSGWAEAIQVTGTGEPVGPGQALLTIASPAVQQAAHDYADELAQRRQSAEVHGAGEAHSGRERLALYGVPEDEIRRVELDRVSLASFTVRSPISAVVAERNVTSGQQVHAGSLLFLLADLSRVWVLADVYEMDYGRVRSGDRATFTADALPGRAFPGRIEFVYPTVSSETRTIKVRLSLDNPGGVLKPGMYGRVRVAGRGGSALTVPAEAVVNTGEHRYVFLAHQDGHFEPRMVWTGVEDGERVQILKGVAEGDTVVASASFLIDSESRLQAAIAGMGKRP